jgi:hypothetical protein
MVGYSIRVCGDVPHHFLEKCGKACFFPAVGMFPEVEQRG